MASSGSGVATSAMKALSGTPVTPTAAAQPRRTGATVRVVFGTAPPSAGSPSGLSCELSAMEAGAPHLCSSAGWSSHGTGASAPIVALASAAALIVRAPRTHTGGGHDGGVPVESHAPVSPTPGPAGPGGASGGSAAGGSGLALSGFFTLAGLLLLAAPRAMRRLRLSCQPWLTACFALIPERPG
jgi:hypothetical protein